MTDLQQFEEAFKSWAASASLPELARCLDLLAAEITGRGPVARSYMMPAVARLAVAVVPSSGIGSSG